MAVALPPSRPVGFQENLRCFFSVNAHRNHVKTFKEAVLDGLSRAEGEVKRELIGRADHFIRTHIGNKRVGKIAQVFDREVGFYREGVDEAHRYFHPANQKGYDK